MLTGFRIQSSSSLLIRSSSRIREPDRFTGFQCLFGNIGGLLIPHVRGDRGDQTDAVLRQFLTALFIGCDAGYAVVHKGADRIGQGIDGLEHTVEDDRLEGI